MKENYYTFNVLLFEFYYLLIDIISSIKYLNITICPYISFIKQCLLYL